MKILKEFFDNGKLKSEIICYESEVGFGKVVTKSFSEKFFDKKGFYESGGKIVNRFVPSGKVIINGKILSYNSGRKDFYNQFIEDLKDPFKKSQYRYIEINNDIYYRDILDGEKLKILVIMFYQTIKSIGGPLNTNKLVIQNLGNIYFCLEELKNNYKDFFYNTKKLLSKDLMEVYYPLGKNVYSNKINRELTLQYLSDYYDEYENSINDKD